MNRRLMTSLFAMLALALSACRDTPLAANVDQNITPIADAGEMQKFDYNGSPVTVHLDGSQSHDPDGKIVTYRWLSGTEGPDGGGRIGPDPEDVESPSVMLDEGIWVFVLFVIDNNGGVSEPSTVTIQVGNGVSPEVSACADAALQSVSEDCRLCVCGVSDMCRTAVVNCSEGCWNLLFCVDSKCGDVDPSDAAAQASCAMSMCAEFLSSGLQTQAISPCIGSPDCTKICSASAQGK